MAHKNTYISLIYRRQKSEMKLFLHIPILQHYYLKRGDILLKGGGLLSDFWVFDGVKLSGEYGKYETCRSYSIKQIKPEFFKINFSGNLLWGEGEKSDWVFYFISLIFCYYLEKREWKLWT